MKINQRMKPIFTNFTFALVILFSFSSGFAHAEKNMVQSLSSAQDEDGNIYLCGFFEGVVNFGHSRLRSNQNSTDLFVAKYDAKGRNLWAIKAGGPGYEVAKSIAITSNGNILVAGTFSGTTKFDFRKVKSKGAKDIFIAELNPSGSVRRLSTYGGRGSEDLQRIVVNEKDEILLMASYNQSFVLAGKTMSQDGDMSAVLACIDKNRRMMWHHNYSNEEGTLLLTDLVVDARGYVSVTGAFSNSITLGNQTMTAKGDLDGFVNSYNAQGKLAFTTLVSTPYSDLPVSLASDNSGNLFLAGTTINGMSSKAFFLVKMNEVGTSSALDKYNVGLESKVLDLEIVGGQSMLLGRFDEHIALNNIPVNAAGIGSFLYSKSTSNASFEWGLSTENIAPGKADLIKAVNRGGFLLVSNRDGVESVIEQGIFLSKIKQDGTVVWSTQAALAEVFKGKDPNERFVDFEGKLLVEEGIALKPLIMSNVQLLDKAGNMLEETVTDDYGDFTFHDLKISKEYQISAKEASEASNGQSLILADHSGTVLGRMDANGLSTFSYKVLPKMLETLKTVELEDSEMKLEAFLDGNEKQTDIDLEIFYPSAQYEIPDVYEFEIKTLARKLRTARDVHIQVFSYTDADGDDALNLELSQKRASAIANFLIKRQVLESQIEAKGFGETEIINRCAEGVLDCSEKEKQANRRTILRLTKS
jgi:outer membrane protein OmpA-like peptidoglycan-associated protein